MTPAGASGAILSPRAGVALTRPSIPRLPPGGDVQVALQRIAGKGTVALLGAEDRSVSAEELATSLRYAWEQTETVRIRLLREVRQQRQLSAPWEHRAERI